MNDRLTLVAYIATLITLALVFIAALIAASLAPDIMGKMEVFGLGTITGGLIGVLRMPARPTGASDETINNLADKIPPRTGDAANTEN
jgi:hypothetical protein